MPPEPVTPDERLEAAREEGRRKLAEAPRAAIYCRISLAMFGDTTKGEDQARIARQMAEQRGWEVAAGVGYPEQNGIYTDNNKTAWQKNRKRPAWNRMLEDVGTGKLDAIVVYHGDRLVRRPEDLTDLIRLADNKGIKLASPTGTYNLDNQRLELWIRAAFAEEESQRTSERKKSQYERWRRAGLVRPGGRGGRAFGFGSDGVTHVPEETAVVREVAARILTGEGIRTIATSLAARGVTTTAGTPMHPIAIRRMIASPRYAGLMPDGEQAAAWEPVLGREEWESAKAITAARSGPLPAGHTARRYLLSGIARCGLCESGLQALTAYTREKNGVHVPATSACMQPGCRKVRRSLALLDAYVTGAAIARLANPANPSGMPAHPDFGPEFQRLATEQQSTLAALADYQQSAGMINALKARYDSIDARLAELRELAADDGRARILEAHAGITADEFAALPLATRRALVSACYTVTVLPASKRGPGFRAEDVQLLPR